jgi:hypothetical protein
MRVRQSTSDLLMIEPVAFGCNPQTAASNHYQHHVHDADIIKIQQQARQEFRNFRDALVNAGANVTTFLGQADSPDDLFPNNWVSTHDDPINHGYILYPMMAENRRLERRPAIIDWLNRRYQIIGDLSTYEQQGQILESTGTIIIDHIHRVAYGCISPRLDARLFAQWGEVYGYETIAFSAYDHTGGQVYHTNVIMYIGTGYAGLCTESIAPDDRERVIGRLSQTHIIIDLSMDQILSFCGNALEIENAQGARLLVMSQQAEQSLTLPQKDTLKLYIDNIVSAPLDTIEKHGGGSARCMILQLF